MLKKILGTGITFAVILALLIIGPVNFKDPLASLESTNAYGYGGGGGGGILYAPPNTAVPAVTHLVTPTPPVTGGNAPTTPAAGGNAPTGANNGITGAVVGGGNSAPNWFSNFFSGIFSWFSNLFSWL